MIHMALQRTVKAAWKREFGFFSLKTTVFLSGAVTLSTLAAIRAPSLNPPGSAVSVWTV